MIFLASDLRPPKDGGQALLRLAGETGVEGLHLGGGCDLELYGRLVAAALGSGLVVPSLALPLPERPLPPGKRLPRLSAHARDEREAAIALARRGLEAASALAARFALLEFGDVPLAIAPGEVERAFARREMDEDEPGARLLAAALAERRARGEQLGDACRWALEQLLRIAERAGLTLVLPVAATPWQVPSPREARQLADAFAGGPVALVWDPGRLSVLAALGLAISDERLRGLAEVAVLALENDAVGVQAGYLPGLAERDARIAETSVPLSVPRIVTGRPDATDAEIAAAVGLVRR